MFNKKFAAILGLVVIIGISIFVYIRLKPTTYEQIPFESQQWLTTNNAGRYLMHDELLDSRILIGKGDNDIEILLGEPDTMWQDENSYEWQYNLGYQESAASVHFPYNYWLYIQFNEDEQVENAYVINRD